MPIMIIVFLSYSHVNTSLCLLFQVLNIVMINIVVLFVQLKLAVYSNWFIAGTMLLGAVIMGKGRTGCLVPAH